MKILIHTCCGPCAVLFTKHFAAQNPDYEPHLLWFNPNIHPLTEYRNRQQAAHAFAQAAELPIIGADSDYGLRHFLQHVHTLDKGARCEYCYHSRLAFAAEQAVAAGLAAFTTTLLASPYQNFELIQRIGGDLARQHGLTFISPDFRANYRNGLAHAREMGLYMQKYCGCIFSEEERYR